MYSNLFTLYIILVIPIVITCITYSNLSTLYNRNYYLYYLLVLRGDNNLSALHIRSVIAIDVITLITEVSHQRDIINLISGRHYIHVDLAINFIIFSTLHTCRLAD